MSRGQHTETYILLRKDRDKGIEILYEKYGTKLYGYGLKSWNLDEDTAWELVYQTLYKVLEKIDDYEFDSEKKFGSFLFTVFCNLLRRNYRDTKKREEKLSFATFNESNFEESRQGPGLGAERQVQNALVEKALDSFREEGGESFYMKCLQAALDELEDWQRILVLMRAQDMPYTQIADFIHKPAGQLKVYHQRARKKLEELLEGKVKLIKQEQSNEQE